MEIAKTPIVKLLSSWEGLIILLTWQQKRLKTDVS